MIANLISNLILNLTPNFFHFTQTFSDTRRSRIQKLQFSASCSNIEYIGESDDNSAPTSLSSVLLSASALSSKVSTPLSASVSTKVAPFCETQSPSKDYGEGGRRRGGGGGEKKLGTVSGVGADLPSLSPIYLILLQLAEN